MEAQIFERNVPLLEAELGEELVALDPSAGQCFGFNGVATSVWRLLEMPRTRAELEQALLAEYEVEPAQCAAELAELLDELVARGLVRIAGSKSIQGRPS